jgi:TonB family protein
MRGLWIVVLFVGLGASISAGQQSSPSASAPVANTKPAKVMVYTAGPGVTAPELLSTNLQPMPDEKCKKKVKSTIPVSIYVDAQGVPRDLTLIYPKDSKLDELALKTVAGDRFNPGTFKGLPVPVAETVTVTLYACMDETKDSSGPQVDQPRLCSPPEQTAIPLQKRPEIDYTASIGTIEKIGPGVSSPYPINQVIPEFSEVARKAKYQGIVLVSVIVDAQGMPHDPRVVRALGMGLDEKAIEAVLKYRFKPAMKNGVPVPVKINIEINFRLYDKR